MACYWTQVAMYMMEILVAIEANYAHSVARRGGPGAGATVTSYNQAAVFTSTCVANVNMYK